jgi:hypothetical protein
MHFTISLSAKSARFEQCTATIFIIQFGVHARFFFTGIAITVFQCKMGIEGALNKGAALKTL